MGASYSQAVTPYVLVGGRSTRMGRDKAFVTWQGSTLLQQAIGRLAPFGPARLLSGDAADSERAAWLAPHGVLVPDRSPGTGPLGGVNAALADLPTAWALIVPIDQPYLPTDALEEWVRAALASGVKASWFVPKDGPEPLPLLLHRDLAAGIAEAHAVGQRRLLPSVKAAAGAATLAFPAAQADWFRNLNHPHDLSPAG